MKRFVPSLVAALLLVFFSGALNANMDGLNHYKDRIIWQEGSSGFHSWVLRGSNARHVGNDPENALKPRFEGTFAPLFEMVNDGWHGSKTLMLFLLLVPIPLLTKRWWFVLLYVPAFMASFHIFYNWILPM